jgi:hypothetical protein
MPEHYWKGCGWRRAKRLRNASQIAIRTTFPVLRIAGYPEHALRNVQPLRRRAKPNATGSNSPSREKECDLFANLRHLNDSDGVVGLIEDQLLHFPWQLIPAQQH